MNIGLDIRLGAQVKNIDYGGTGREVCISLYVYIHISVSMCIRVYCTQCIVTQCKEISISIYMTIFYIFSCVYIHISISMYISVFYE